MAKKLVILALALAGLLVPQKVNMNEYLGQMQSENFYESIEKSETENEVKKTESNEEKWKDDKIWGMINSVYNKLDAPEYISKEFVRGLVKVESSDYPKAVSYRGARGLGQIMEKTWYNFEKSNFKKNAFIPEKNIEVTIKYLKWIDKFCSQNNPEWENLSKNKKIILASACYNGGPVRLKNLNWNEDKMPDETIEYIGKVKRALRKNLYGY